jgi:hypothetical protein
MRKGDQTQLRGDGSIIVPFMLCTVVLCQPRVDAPGDIIDRVAGILIGPLSTRENRGAAGGGDGVDPSPTTAALPRRSPARRLQFGDDSTDVSLSALFRPIRRRDVNDDLLLASDPEAPLLVESADWISGECGGGVRSATFDVVVRCGILAARTAASRNRHDSL